MTTLRARLIIALFPDDLPDRLNGDDLLDPHEWVSTLRNIRSEDGIPINELLDDSALRQLDEDLLSRLDSYLAECTISELLDAYNNRWTNNKEMN